MQRLQPSKHTQHLQERKRKRDAALKLRCADGHGVGHGVHKHTTTRLAPECQRREVERQLQELEAAGLAELVRREDVQLRREERGAALVRLIDREVDDIRLKRGGGTCRISRCTPRSLSDRLHVVRGHTHSVTHKRRPGKLQVAVTTRV